MSKQKPTIPSGMRDFLPRQAAERKYIFDVIRTVFEKFGYQPIETPAMERLAVLSGKYGEEGEQLMYKVLDSGNFLQDSPTLKAYTEQVNTTPPPHLPLSQFAPPAKFAMEIAEKALRYDLTVPFARFVVMHRNELAFPFRRYQIQNVWRADRPQKGRYREFYQCDADVVGTASLLCEAEFILMYDEALSNLGITDFTIKFNHRKLLTALAERAGCGAHFVDFCTALDKLDKIGLEGVAKEFTLRGIDAEQALAVITPLMTPTDSVQQAIAQITPLVSTQADGTQALADIHQMLEYLGAFPLRNAKLALDFTLARGLNYYTGMIFEVKANGVQVGSIGGGGRYDNLTGAFGVEGLTGAGISFGADRIHDVLTELALLTTVSLNTTKVLVINFGGECTAMALDALRQLRNANIPAELYPESGAKLAKQFGYADKKAIAYCLIIGENELSSGTPVLKDMQSGEQAATPLSEVILKLTQK